MGIMVLFVALFVQLNWLQVVHATALDHNPLNGRPVVKEYDTPRGDIISADGVTLAHSEAHQRPVQVPARSIPTGSLFGQITGYFSFTYGVGRGGAGPTTGSSPAPTAPFKLPTSLSSCGTS